MIRVTSTGSPSPAVIYGGLDPVTGREIRRWHAAGTEEAARSSSPTDSLATSTVLMTVAEG